MKNKKELTRREFLFWLGLASGSLAYTACTPESVQTQISTPVPTRTILATSTMEEPTITPSPTESPPIKPTFIFNFKVDAYNGKGAYKLRQIYDFFSNHDIPLVISIPPSLNGMDINRLDLTPDFCRRFALESPHLVEFSIDDNSSLIEHSIDNTIQNISFAQEKVAYALWADYPNWGRPTLYPTTFSIDLSDLTQDTINVLLQAGIKTGIYSGSWKTDISDIDKGFLLCPEMIVYGESNSAQDILSKTFTHPEVISIDSSKINDTNIQRLFEFIEYFANAKDADDIRIVKPTDLYFDNGGYQNIIVRLDDLLLGVEDLFFGVIKHIQEVTSSTSLGVAVVPFDDSELEEHPISYSEKSVQYFQQNPSIDILVHGINYKRPEFSRSAHEQKEIMVRYANFLSSVFNRKMEVLAPPLSAITEDTIKIMAETRKESLTDLTILSCGWPKPAHKMPIGTDKYGNYHTPPLIDVADWGNLDDTGHATFRPLDEILMDFGQYQGKPVFANDLIINIHPLELRTEESIHNLRTIFYNLINPKRKFIGFTEYPGYQAFKALFNI